MKLIDVCKIFLGEDGMGRLYKVDFYIEMVKGLCDIYLIMVLNMVFKMNQKYKFI